MTFTSDQEAAVLEFVSVFDGYTLADLGKHLTCTEARTWVEMLNAFQAYEKASWLLEAHAMTDDEGDDHYVEGNTCTECGRLFDTEAAYKVCHTHDCSLKGQVQTFE